MQCPICNVDLSPLDLVSRTEHVDLCIENGPSVLELNEANQLVVKKNLPPNKQRKICPICSKTFQSLFAHFKTCAIKHDVPPSLMLEHWEAINKEAKSDKKFPRELLDNFVARSVKDGREGDQVDFARALSLSMAEAEPARPNRVQESGHRVTQAPVEDQTAEARAQPENQINAVEILMRSTGEPSNQRQNQSKKKFRIELVDEELRKSNIALRIDRELAASRSRRYYEALRDSGKQPASRRSLDEDDDECIVIEDDSPVQVDDGMSLNKLFFLSRMKDCDGSELCLEAKCEGHELRLMLDEHRFYSGASMDAPTKTKHQDFNSETLVGEPSTSHQEDDDPSCDNKG